MKVKKEININVLKDTYIFATFDGKLSLHGKFIDLITIITGIICRLYDCGTDSNKEFLKTEFVDAIKKLAENNFDVDILK